MNSSGNYAQWSNAPNKGDPRWYENYQFLIEYTELHMERKAEHCSRLIANEIERLLREGSGFVSPNGTRILRCLSLGCGPGTDMLAVIKACLRQYIAGAGNCQLYVDCTGVDRVSWPLHRLYGNVTNILASTGSSNFSGRCIVYKEDCSAFVQTCIARRITFDLVICCYADAKDKIQLLGQHVPHLLDSSGRIFIIDNFSDQLMNSLADYRFQTVQGYDARHWQRPAFLVYKNIFNYDS